MKREWLIQFRKSKEMTQEKVASDAFIDRGYYSQIETGKRDPGINVAINISKVLDFDPLMFFQEQFSANPQQGAPLKGGITEFFKKKSNGRVIYLYNNKESYLYQAITFLLTGVETKSFRIMIDDRNNINQIQQSLQAMLTKDEMCNSILFIDHDEFFDYEPEKAIQYVQSQFKGKRSIGIWLRDEQFCFPMNWLYMIENDIKAKGNELDYESIKLIRCYNATKISAGDHIKMMRIYPFLMTDYEIVNSPIYLSSNNSKVSPSLFLQEKSTKQQD
ncbi:helix-turn-helix domain-containing protein [Salinibacillus xinjiangensis]|uniref:Helix-turn-helix domain-containing protein n=1 Tax=Salinibacillus xinjiangensis TaxID=1229268 RepID=A0A6G1X9K3_9BACI|nr:helix-turn-helix transcriptional regulator [Salinibacillus xinjiangensis]MRG87585.1 helix-turn-helix domain-containing protein [Salinibacillus xinjiangensis]